MLALGLLSGSHHGDAINFPASSPFTRATDATQAPIKEGEGPSSQALFLVELAAIAVSSPLDRAPVLRSRFDTWNLTVLSLIPS